MQRLTPFFLAGAVALLSHGVAQAVNGPLDSPDKAELAAYSTLYWQYADAQTPGAGAGSFQFTDPNLNSPLFNPYRASLRKVQAAKGIYPDTTESCSGSPGSVTATDIKSFMIDGTISTPLDQTAEVSAHLAKLLEALDEGQEVAVANEDGKLVTVGLDPKTLQLVPIDSAPVPANSAIADLFNSVATAAGQLAATQDLSHVVSDPLVGHKPYWAAFMQGLDRSLGAAAVTIEARVTGLDAAFGDYGCLVLARVETNQGVYLLVDTVNGAVAGPYSDSAPYDARALLATHPEYVDGQTIEYFGKGDCATTMPVASIKTPIPRGPPGFPAGWTPQTPLPPNFTVPGNPSDWVCVFTPVVPATTPPTGSCTCTSTYTWIYSGPGPCPYQVSTFLCLIYETWTCASTAPVGTAGCPSKPNTWPSPPPAGGPIAPGGTPGCTPSYYRWS